MAITPLRKVQQPPTGKGYPAFRPVGLGGCCFSSSERLSPDGKRFGPRDAENIGGPVKV
jgi:hypothetical protein